MNAIFAAAIREVTGGSRWFQGFQWFQKVPDGFRGSSGFRRFQKVSGVQMVPVGPDADVK